MVRSIEQAGGRTQVSDNNSWYEALTLNVRGPSYLGLTRSLRRQDISNHDIDYVK